MEFCPHCGAALDPLDASDQCESCGEDVGREPRQPEVDTEAQDD